MLCIKQASANDVDYDELQKFALIIGNANYHDNELNLKNPLNDASAINNKLLKLGFKTILVRDGTKHEIKKGFAQQKKRIRAAERTGKPVASLLFYAGHGIQFENVNYIVPADVNIQNKPNPTNYDIKQNLVSIKSYTSSIANFDNFIDIIILDACRDFPLSNNAQSVGGWADLGTTGFYIAFGTEPGSTASDGVHSTDNNGVFTSAILNHIETKGITLSQMFQRVRKDVLVATDNQQKTEDKNHTTKDFYFVPGFRNLHLFILFATILSLVLGAVWFVFYHKRQLKKFITGIDLTAHILKDQPEFKEHYSRSRLQKDVKGYVKDLRNNKLLCLIYDKPLVVGREVTCNVHLPDESNYISRQHCEIGWDEAQKQFWVRENKESANGTFVGKLLENKVNKGKITPKQPYFLNDGEVIYLADPNEHGWPITIIKHAKTS